MSLLSGAEEEGCGVARGVLQRAERVFPDGPVAKTPCFPSGVAGSVPGWELRSHMPSSQK